MDWDKILEEHGSTLVLYARQWANSHADAEDAVQEACIKVWKGFEEKRTRIRNVVPYIFSAVRTVSLDRLKSNKRRDVREKKAGESMYEDEPIFKSNLDQSERMHSIQTALKSLPEDQKEVLVMKIWGEMTFKTIAQALCIPPNTAASRYRYALTNLKKQLDKKTL